MGCKWLFVEGSRSGRGRLLEPTSDCHFFLSLEGACLFHLVWQPTGLVVRLAPCHLSQYANTPWLEGGWVSKSCLFGREDSIEIAKTLIALFEGVYRHSGPAYASNGSCFIDALPIWLQWFKQKILERLDKLHWLTCRWYRWSFEVCQ